MNTDQPKLISGGQFSDERGSISFVNDFSLDDIKRFYIIKHPDSHIIRAWQAHKEEIKYFYVLKGSFEIKLVKIFNWQTPKSSSTILNYKLSEIDKFSSKSAYGFC